MLCSRLLRIFAAQNMNMENKLEILITNDDGIASKGLHVLAGMMAGYGNVTVVAPKNAQSGKSAAISLDTALYLTEESKSDGIRMFSFNGTPVDCVKIAVNELFADRMPDILVSGINHGSNCSVAALYSGTLGACIEGTLYEIPSIGLSVNDHGPEPDFSAVLKYGRIIIDRFIENRLPKHVYLNVNFPALPATGIKGIRFAKRGYGRWIKEFTKEKDADGKDCFRMSGQFENLEATVGNADHMLMHNGYISIVPHSVDTTDYNALDCLQSDWKL